MIPSVLAGLLLGGWIDRSAKRPLLIATDLARALAVLALPLLAWSGQLAMWHLLVVAVVVGGASSLFAMADGAFLPTVVRRHQLVAGNQRLAVTDSLAEVGGPAAGGVLIDLLTAPVAVVDALTYLWSALWLLSMRVVEVPAGDAQHGRLRQLLADLALAARSGLGHPQVGPTLVAIAMMELFGGFLVTTYTLFALTVLSLTPGQLGMVIGAGGIGAMAGVAVAGALARWCGHGRALLLTLAGGQAAALAIPLAAVIPERMMALLVAHQLIGDALLVAFLVLATSLRQVVLPQAIIARTQGLLLVMTGTLLPVGAFTAAAVAGAHGVTTAVWLGAVGGLAAALPLVRPALLRMVRLPE